MGQTSQKLSARIANHKSSPIKEMKGDVEAAAAEGQKWNQAFEFATLAVTRANQHEADHLEKKFIKDLRTLQPAGYNKVRGNPAKQPWTWHAIKKGLYNNKIPQNKKVLQRYDP